MLDVVGLFLLLAGFVIGLGAVTVIDVHGLLGMRSSYWTEATIRTHKVTKPLIWIGVIVAILGGLIFYRNEALTGIPLFHACVAIILLLNGLFLSFVVSPYLLQREREGKAAEILPTTWQRKIALSLVFSDVGWWVSLFLLATYLIHRGT